jgi:hypothetical protein
MTGAVQVLMAAGMQLVIPAVTLSDTTAGGNAHVDLGLKNDGSIVVTGKASTCVPPWWYAVGAVAGIGASYWCKLTVNSGTPPPGGVGTLVLISTLPAWSMDQTVVGSRTGNWTIDIFSDAGAVQRVSSFTFNATATRT